MRHRRGLAAAVTGALLLSATAVLGISSISWGNASLNSKQAELVDTVNNYVNKINESIFFENINCNTTSCDVIKVALTNIGDVGLNVAEITISDAVTGFKHVESYQNLAIMPDGMQLISITDPNIPLNAALELTLTTSRGNIFSTMIST